MVLADTTVLIDILRNDPLTLKKLESYDETISTSTICAFEVLSGTKNSYDEKATIMLFDQITIIDFSLDNAKTAANIFKELKKKGITIGNGDCLIAACAIDTGQTLLTKNTKHFSNIAKLKVEGY